MLNSAFKYDQIKTNTLAESYAMDLSSRSKLNTSVSCVSITDIDTSKESTPLSSDMRTFLEPLNGERREVKPELSTRHYMGDAGTDILCEEGTTPALDSEA